MSFDYSVELNDPTNIGGSIDAILVYDLQQALGIWSQFISGLGTIVVSLNIQNTDVGRADGGPTTSFPVGSNAQGATIYEPAASYELATGHHVSGSTSDITIDFDPGYFKYLDLRFGLTYGSQVSPNTLNPITVDLHELMHGFGMSGFFDQSGKSAGNYESTFDALIQKTSTGAFFIGANAEAAYGGPVPLTNTSTTQNYYHFGNQQSDLYASPSTVADPLTLDLMNGIVFFDNYPYQISKLDLGVLKDLGYNILSPSPAVTLSLSSDTGASSTDKVTSNPSLVGSGDAYALVTLSENGATLGTTTADQAGAWTFTPTNLSDGVHTIVASETNAAGTVGTSSLKFTLDTMAPNVTIALKNDTGASSSDHITSDGTLVGTGDPDARVSIVVLPESVAHPPLGFSSSTTADGTGAWQIVPNGLGGPYVTYLVTASETDLAGNVGTSSIGVTIESVTPPSGLKLAVDTGSSATDNITSNDQLTAVTFDSLRNFSVSFSENGKSLGSTGLGPLGQWTFTPTGLADGVHTITATATDGAGNTSSSNLTFTLDTTAPVVDVSLVTDTGSSSTDRVTSNDALKGTGDADVLVTLTENEKILGTTTADHAGAWTFTPTGLVDGQHMITASETDVAGNVGSSALVFTLDTATVSAPAHVTSVTTSGSGIVAGTGDLHLGAVIVLTLNFSEAVLMSNDSPTLKLNNGGVATYVSGSGSDALKFSYTVGSGQDISDLNVIGVQLNGATIGTAGSSIILPGSGQSLVDAGHHVFAFGDVYQNGDYHIFRDGTQDGIGLKLALVNGIVYDDTASFGWFADSDGHFVYEPTAPVLNSGVAADLSGAVTNPAGVLQIETTVAPPAKGAIVTSVEASGNAITDGAGDLHVGAMVTLTLNFNEAVVLSDDSPNLLLNNGGTATYMGGSGTDALKFSYTVLPGQNTPDLAVSAVHLNSATIDTVSSSVLVPGGQGSLTDAEHHVFSFGDAYQDGDYHILRDGTQDGIGLKLALVNGVVYDDTASFGWFADHDGHFVYQPTAPVLASGAAVDVSGAVTNPVGVLQIDTGVAPPASSSGAIVTSVDIIGNGITAGSGDVSVGEVLTLTLKMSQATSVSGGTPSLHLNDGGVATYASGSGSGALNFVYTVGAGHNVPDLTVTQVDLNGAAVGTSAPTIAPGTAQSLVDAGGHVFSFGSAVQGDNFNILRDGVPDGIGKELALVHGVVFDNTASYGWFADSAGHFVYQAIAPLLDVAVAADLSAAVTNPAGILHVDHGFMMV